jgi:hypothetical protein
MKQAKVVTLSGILIPKWQEPFHPCLQELIIDGRRCRLAGMEGASSATIFVDDHSFDLVKITDTDHYALINNDDSLCEEITQELAIAIKAIQKLHQLCNSSTSFMHKADFGKQLNA